MDFNNETWTVRSRNVKFENHCKYITQEVCWQELYYSIVEYVLFVCDDEVKLRVDVQYRLKNDTTVWKAYSG